MSTTSSQAEDLGFELSGKLTRWFCGVQAVVSAMGALAWPSAWPAFGTAAVILVCMLAAREAVDGMADKARAKRLFDVAWCFCMAGWIPFGFGLRGGVISITCPSAPFAFGSSMWVLFALFQRHLGAMSAPF